jgi:hypothetical protein
LRAGNCSGEPRCDGSALAIGQRPDRLVLSHGKLREKRTGANIAPATLTRQELRNWHRGSLWRAGQDDLGY